MYESSVHDDVRPGPAIKPQQQVQRPSPRAHVRSTNRSPGVWATSLTWELTRFALRNWTKRCTFGSLARVLVACEPRTGSSHLGVEDPLTVNGMEEVEADRVEIVLGYPLKP